MPDSIPLNWYVTDDFAEVTLLSTIGIPWADDSNRFANIYPESFLRQIGKTAEQAQAAGIPGKVHWMFKATPELDAALAIFRAVWKTPDTEREVHIEDDSIPDVIRGIALALKNRGMLAQDFKRGSPKVCLERNGKPQAIICRTTSKEALAQMGLSK